MNLETKVTHESKALPGVTFIIRRMNQIQRARRDAKIIDARVRISELTDQLKGIPEDGTATEKLQRAKLDAQIGIEIVTAIKPAYVRAGLVSVDGLTIDSQPVKPEDLIESGQDDLLDEVYEACVGASGLSADQSKNSPPSGISAVPAPPDGQSTTVTVAAA